MQEEVNWLKMDDECLFCQDVTLLMVLLFWTLNHIFR